jgi:hypothetical protein
VHPLNQADITGGLLGSEPPTSTWQQRGNAPLFARAVSETNKSAKREDFQNLIKYEKSKFQSEITPQGWGYCSVVERLPGMLQALGSSSVPQGKTHFSVVCASH